MDLSAGENASDEVCLDVLLSIEERTRRRIRRRMDSDHPAVWERKTGKAKEDALEYASGR